MEFKGVIYKGEEISDVELWKSLPADLKSYYRDVNGIIAYQGGLHIRGCVGNPDWHSLRQVWSGPWALHLHFNEIREKDIPFAQDCLGDQYFWRLGTVWRLFLDNGEVEDLELEFYDFLEEVEKDPVDLLDLEPLVYFLDQGNDLSPGHILISDPPLSVEADHYSFSAINVKEFFNHLINPPD